MNDALQQQLAFLPAYLGGHLALSLGAIVVGILFSIPLGMISTRVPWLRSLALVGASTIQTIPGLALLAIMVAALGRIGFVPAYIALVMYGLLPMLRNTITGIEGVDKDVVEAARGVGMSPAQILLQVELPLAMPVILAGIRTAMVWTVGLATISTPVGATSLGNYIFSGLQTQNFTAVMVGCVSSAALAFALDGFVRLLETNYIRERIRIATRRLTENILAASESARGKAMLTTAAIVVVALVFSAMASIVAWRTDGDRFVVGGKGFTEQYILAELLAMLLREEGVDVEVRNNLGSTIIFTAAANGDVDAYIEYSGTAWANYMNRDDNPGRIAIREQVEQWLESEYDLVALGAIGFENNYALAMRAEDAAALGITSIADLARQAPNLRIASDYEFFSRPEWFAVRDAYGLEFDREISMDSTLMYEAIKEDQADVISAYTTDGRIAAYDLAILEDPKTAFLPYDAMVFLSPKGTRPQGAAGILAKITGSIDSKTMRQANRMVDVDKQTVQTAAEWLRAQLPR